MVDPVSANLAEIGTATSPSIRAVGKRLSHSFAVYGAANFGIRALNLLLILFYSRYLRPSDFGIIYLAATVSVFLILFGNLAIDSALQRLYFQFSRDPVELQNYVGTVIRFGMSSCVILLLFSLLLGNVLQTHLTP